MMRYLVSYDISKAKKRYHVIRILQDFGCWRIQKSIYYFEGTPSLMEKMRLNLIKYFRNESLIIIPIEKKMVDTTKYLGDCKDDLDFKNYIFI